MDERGLRAVLRPTPPARVLAGAGAARWWMDPVTVDCALQLQVIWARLNWGVTLLPAEIGAVRPVAGLAGDAIRLELRVRPDSRAPLCHADHVFTSLDGRLLGTLDRRRRDRIEGPQPARRARARAHDGDRASPSSACRACSPGRPTSARTGATSSARSTRSRTRRPRRWTPPSTTTPTSRDEDATYTKRGGYLGSLAAFDSLAHGIPPVAVGGEPDQWLALQIARDALADAGALDLPAAVRERTSIVLGKGTYLNGGNAIAVQRGLVIGQTMELLRRLHPEHPEEELEALRREMQRVLPPLTADTVPGLIPNIIVGRIANRLDLMGPAYTVDAACASSLVALAARRPRPARPASATWRWPAGRRCGCPSRR